jgi:2-dehydropantoate 2-reductase
MADVAHAETDPVLVWGAGAIGGLFAYELISAGVPVHVVDIDEAHVARMRSSGLTLMNQGSERTCAPIISMQPADVSRKYRRVLLCVKGHHTEQAAKSLRPHLLSNGWVLSLQNGLTEQRIASIVGEDRVVGAHVNVAADYLESGRIQLGGPGTLLVGPMAQGQEVHAREAAALLQRGLPETRYTSNILGYKWSKVCLGAMLFVTAMSNRTMADQFEDEALAPLWIALAQEVLAVAAACGVSPEPFDGFDPRSLAPGARPESARASLDVFAMHCRTAWAGKPHAGIWRDLYVRKRTTEVDPQITDVVRYGHMHGLHTPLVARLVELIREVESGRRSASPDNAFELMEVTA